MEWIGPHDAEIIVFNKGGRDRRWQLIQAGEEAPREFLYGFPDASASGDAIAMVSTVGMTPGTRGWAAARIESVFSRMTHLGIRPFTLHRMVPTLRRAHVLIGFTDGFSATLGLAGAAVADGAVRIGGFHALSDLETRARPLARPLVRHLVGRALAGLDLAFFFGAADRDECVRRYGIPRQRTGIFAFGIDTDFWRPDPDATAGDFVVAIGQDPNRDYDLLARAPGRHPMRIITRQKVSIPAGHDHVRTSVGDYFGADSISDAGLRRLYNAARAVVVPLRDVFQPSGYSVTLQAMSCGRPVILTRTKGLWAPEIMVDGDNCLLVPPGDPDALAAAMARVRGDPEAAAAIGRRARETACRHFPLSNNAASLRRLIELGRALRGTQPR